LACVIVQWVGSCTFLSGNRDLVKGLLELLIKYDVSQCTVEASRGDTEESMLRSWSEGVSKINYSWEHTDEREKPSLSRNGEKASIIVFIILSVLSSHRPGDIAIPWYGH
jgi:hypothetical protein